MSSITTSLLNQRILPKLQEHADQSTSFDIYALFSAIAMDFVTAYLFGLGAGSNLTQDDEFRAHFLELYNSRQSYTFWPQEIPGLTSLLGRFLVPKWVDDANTEIEEWTLSMCDNAASFMRRTQVVSADSLPPEELPNFPTVYSQLQSAMSKHASKEQCGGAERERLEIASEVLDQLAAGFDTSGITLTYIVHELSQRPDVQASLRKELLTLDPPVLLSRLQENKSLALPTAKSLDALPILNAIVDETLRLRAAIPGPEPRVTPPGGCSIGPEGEFTNIPGGLRISASAHSLHRNPEVFDNPDEWMPERYLTSSEAKLKEMRRWFWAFGSGGRMCVGSNLALQEIKYVLAAIYTNFTTHIVDDTGIEQMDTYTAPPKGGKLVVRLDHAAD
jgi:cytochrome P450